MQMTLELGWGWWAFVLGVIGIVVACKADAILREIRTRLRR
jgi:hypothetical protein